MTEENRWTKYYEATGGREPRKLLVDAVEMVGTKLPKVAMDIGFGTGNETIYLLHKGWEVTAIDQEEEAASILKERVKDDNKLHIVTSSFEDMELHPSSLIHAGFSLPFTQPEYFNQVWTGLTRAVNPGGIFCGQLFGLNDEWSDNEEMTFHSKEQVKELLKNFDLINLEEIDDDLKTATGNSKHWNYFNIIAKKRTANN